MKISKFENFNNCVTVGEIIDITEYILYDLKDIHDGFDYILRINNFNCEAIKENEKLLNDSIKYIELTIKASLEIDLPKTTQWIDVIKSLFISYKNEGIKNVPTHFSYSWKFTPFINVITFGPDPKLSYFQKVFNIINS